MSSAAISLWGDQPPAPAHKQVLQDSHRFIVLVAGRKFRKTSISLAKLFKGALTTPLVYPYIAPYRRQAKLIVWDDHVPRMLGYLSKAGIPFKKNDSNLSIKFPSGGQFQLDGSDNADALRGIGNWGGLALGEYSDWKADVWEPIIRPNLMTTKAWAIFEGTPKGFNHFHRLAKKGDHQRIIEGDVYDDSGQVIPAEKWLDDDFNTWRFTSYDNPYLDPGEIEKAKQSSTAEWFSQEYLAKFTKFTGLVYKEFNREVHVIDPFDIPNAWPIYRGFDFGSTNPTVCLWVAMDDDDNWFLVSEHYESGKTIDYHAGVINSNPFSRQAEAGSGYGDPSGAQWIKEFSNRGIYITPADKQMGSGLNDWVRLGIEKIAERLRPIPGHIVPLVKDKCPDRYGEGGAFKMPALYVFSTCVNTIREFETYKWKQGRQVDLNEPDVPEKANDHALDALRYIAISSDDLVEQEPNPITAEGESTRIVRRRPERDPNRNIISDGGGIADLF